MDRQKPVPFQININTKWKKYGITIAGGNGYGNRSNQLFHPYSIYVDDNNQRIYIADFSNHRIIEWKFRANNGQVVAGGNGKGNQPNQLMLPRGLSFDREGNLYVADFLNHRAQKYLIDSN